MTLRLTIDGAMQQLMEDRLVETVTAQFSDDTLSGLQRRIAQLRKDLAELYQQQQDLEHALSNVRDALLRECEAILEDQRVIECK